MMKRGKTIFLFLLILMSSVLLLKAQVRRGVLVGINEYKPPEIEPSDRPPRQWRNLKGAVNDVAAVKGVLVGRFGFEEENLLVLTDEEATREGILGAIERHLIDEVNPGDVCVFYFAGHGSQIRNILSKEPDRMDETLVPADWYLHGDIRDKELKVSFNRILDKKATLTVIVDACHSGSISRGIPSSVEYRSLSPSTASIEDARLMADPVGRGALVLSAAQDFELAREKKFEQNLYHGVFSWALTRVLGSMPIDEPANHIFMKVNALMQSEGCYLKFSSTPNLELRGEKRNQPLFGIPKGTQRTVTATALHIHHKLITLQGGIATGIYNGCRLKKIDPDNTLAPAIIEVFRSLGLDQCQAKVVEGSPAAIKSGDFFEIHRWAAPPETRMKVWMPACNLEPADILHIAKEARAGVEHSDAIQWVDDPTRVNPTHIMSCHDNHWQITSADGAITSLGDRPSSRNILQVLRAHRTPGAAKPRFFLRLPLDRHTQKQIEARLAYFKAAIEITASNHNAHYILTGRFNDNHIEYSWLLPNQTAHPIHRSILPIHTAWQSAVSFETLCSHLLRLVKIRAWHQLPSPPDNGQFPYSLILKNINTKKLAANRPLIEGETFELALQVNGKPPEKSVFSRYIYIFAIDNQGTGTLLFPAKKRMNSENHFPPRDRQRQKIITLGIESGFRVKPPFGTDTFFLLSTKQAVSNPEVLDFSGVYRDFQIPEHFSPLERLLFGLGSGARKRLETTPISWSIQRLSVQTIPATSGTSSDSAD